MKYLREEIEQWLRTSESSGLEFKQIEFAGDVPKHPTRADWAKSFVAFANSEGGILLAGVDDDGKGVGLSKMRTKALGQMLAEICSDAIKPPVRIYTQHIEFSDGKLVLLVEVPKGDTVHKCSDGIYVRVGPSIRLMEGDEELRLAQRRAQSRFLWFDKQPVPETSYGTLLPELWKPLLSIESANDPRVGLEKLALLHKNGNGNYFATVTGILICTANPEQWFPNACIMATRYRGSDRASGQVDAAEITGPLYKQIANATAFAVRNMHVAARKDPARVNLPQYSQRALFEAIVNAVVHRDYTIQGSRIRLSMFDDRVEIQSPGALPNSLTIENMSTRQSVRNEALTSVFSRMRVGGILGSEDRLYIMERRGDGVPIIQRETRELTGKYPEYRIIDNSEVLLVIPAAIQEPSPAHPIVAVWSNSKPLANVNLLFIYPNKTWVQATTDESGKAAVNLHTAHLPVTVYAAAPGYAAYLETWTPSERALAIDLQELPDGGSVILPESEGCIPGLKGGISPVLDDHDRTCIYAHNMMINEGMQQPVHFILGEAIQLIDSEEREMQVRVVGITGRSALVEYRSVRA